MSYEIDEITDFVDGGRKQLKISPRANPVVVYGGTWKLLLDRGMGQLTHWILGGELAAKDIGIFLLLVEHMEPGNRMGLTQIQVAERIKSHQSVVSRSMQKLKAVGLVRGAMLNPEIITKGRTEDYEATLQAWHKLGGEKGPRQFGNATVTVPDFKPVDHLRKPLPDTHRVHNEGENA